MMSFTTCTFQFFNPGATFCVYYLTFSYVIPLLSELNQINPNGQENIFNWDSLVPLVSLVRLVQWL